MVQALKNFAIFTGKHLCWSPFLGKLQVLKPTNLLKRRLQHRYFPVNIAKLLKTVFSIEHLVAASGIEPLF